MAVKRYRVVGTAKVCGHAPGEVFEADLPPEQEAPLLKIGAVQVVTKGDGERKSASKSAPSPSSPRRG